MLVQVYLLTKILTDFCAFSGKSRDTQWLIPVVSNLKRTKKWNFFNWKKKTEPKKSGMNINVFFKFFILIRLKNHQVLTKLKKRFSNANYNQVIDNAQ